MFWIDGLLRRFSASSFCDFWKVTFSNFITFFSFMAKEIFLNNLMCVIRRIIAYLCLNMINFDAVDFIPQSHLLRRPYGLTFLRSVEILRPPQYFYGYMYIYTLAVTFATAAVWHIFYLWRQKNCGCPTSFEVMTHGRRRASLRQP